MGSHGGRAPRRRSIFSPPLARRRGADRRPWSRLPSGAIPSMLRTDSSRSPLAGVAARLSKGLALALVALLAAAGRGDAQVLHAQGKSISGYVYVMTNEGGVSGRNAIRAFQRDNRG